MNHVRGLLFIGILFLFLISTIAPSGLVLEGKHMAIQGSQPCVLVTGFEPFGKYDVNPSQLIAEALNGTEIKGVRIIGIVVPVNFTKSVAVVTQAIEEYQPLFVLSIGLAASSKRVRLENVGINLKKDPNVAGINRNNQSGPLFRFSSLPSAKIFNELKRSGIPVRQSWFAGTYVCNALLYGVLGYITDHDLDTHMGFLHVPLLSSQNPQGMPLQTLINATQIAITVSLQEI
ncbi:MAG: pyroglutamyl-peptidase I [Euryarchaeota archaeon]|nr:pyroglutamyl-peptidase I [Euryarchaeota archaeon]